MGLPHPRKARSLQNLVVLTSRIALCRLSGMLLSKCVGLTLSERQRSSKVWLFTHTRLLHLREIGARRTPKCKQAEQPCPDYALTPDKEMGYAKHALRNPVYTRLPHLEHTSSGQATHQTPQAPAPTTSGLFNTVYTETTFSRLRDPTQRNKHTKSNKMGRQNKPQMKQKLQRKTLMNWR